MCNSCCSCWPSPVKEQVDFPVRSSFIRVGEARGGNVARARRAADGVFALLEVNPDKIRVPFFVQADADAVVLCPGDGQVFSMDDEAGGRPVLLEAGATHAPSLFQCS